MVSYGEDVELIIYISRRKGIHQYDIDVEQLNLVRRKIGMKVTVQRALNAKKRKMRLKLKCEAFIGR